MMPRLQMDLPGTHSTGGSDKDNLVRVFVICLIGFLLQVILAPNIAINGISPNFMLVVLALVAIITTQFGCVVAGFVMGLLFDLLGGGPVGSMTLVMSVVGFALPMLIKSVSTQSFVSWIIVMAVVSVVSFLAYDVVCAITGYETSFLASIVFKVLPWAVYTLVAAAIAFPIMRKTLGRRNKSIKSRISL